MSENDSGYDILHHGGNNWTAARKGAVYRVDMDAETPGRMVTAVGQNNEVTGDTRSEVLSAVIAAGPEYREGPQEQLSVTVEATGNPAPTAQSGGSGGSEASDSGEDDAGISSTITQEHDYDLAELEDDVTSWLAKAAGFKGDINPEWVSVEQAQATIPGGYDDPDAGQTVVGFQLDTAPWFTGAWDRDDGWESGEAEDKFSDHREALTGEGGVFRTTEQVLGIQDDDGYYDNFLPASRVGDL